MTSTGVHPLEGQTVQIWQGPGGTAALANPAYVLDVTPGWLYVEVEDQSALRRLWVPTEHIVMLEVVRA